MLTMRNSYKIIGKLTKYSSQYQQAQKQSETNPHSFNQAQPIYYTSTARQHSFALIIKANQPYQQPIIRQLKQLNSHMGTRRYALNIGQLFRLVQLVLFDLFSDATNIRDYNNIIFTGDMQEGVYINKYNPQSSTLQPVSQSMNNKGPTTTSIAIYVPQDSQKQSRVFTCALNGKCNIWKYDDFSRLNTWGNVHKGEVLAAEVIGDVLVTSGEDLLVKLHNL